MTYAPMPRVTPLSLINTITIKIIEANVSLCDIIIILMELCKAPTLWIQMLNINLTAALFLSSVV